MKMDYDAAIFELDKLARFVKFPENEKDFMKLLRNFQMAYEPIECKTVVLERQIKKAQEDLLEEIKATIQNGLRKDLSWHKTEIRLRAEALMMML